MCTARPKDEILYGKGDNVKDCYSVEDLKWCYQTFYKEYL
jgi:hypothetical protein